MAIFEASPPIMTGANIALPNPAVASSVTSHGAKDAAGSPTVATRPSLRYIVFSVGCLAAGLVGGLLLQRAFHPGVTKLPVLPASVGTFALLYVMAQAIERVLVPVSWFGGGFLGGLGDNAIKECSRAALTRKRQVATVAALGNPTDQTTQAAANAQHDLDQYKANLTGTTFGIAALLAMLVSGYAGVFLLHIVGLKTAGWLDILVTGLAIAGGTKPLHDLISNVSSGKKSAASAA